MIQSTNSMLPRQLCPLGAHAYPRSRESQTPRQVFVTRRAGRSSGTVLPQVPRDGLARADIGQSLTTRGRGGRGDEDMIWLALWCGSGAIVGYFIGRFTGRPAVGTVLGTFCGAFGWLIVLGADPRERAAHAPPDRPDSAGPAEITSGVDDVGITQTLSPKPISWTASAERQLLASAE
jgi:hypothetical protein